jgi:cell division inhibitor SepF
MGLVDRFKSFIGYPDEKYYSEEEDQQMEEVVGGTSYSASSRVEEFPGTDKRSNKVVNIHATTQLQVVLVKPERFEDASGIADHLNAKRTIVLNLEQANKDVTRRLIDFLSGVAYANNGQIKKVANSTYIITPYNVGIMGDLLDELESSGVFF